MATAVVAEREATERAMVAAIAEGVRVVGQGTLGESGMPFLLVSSASELGRVHVCRYVYEGVFVGSRMVCDCLAAQYGKSCKHVLVAREWLAVLTRETASTSPSTERPRRRKSSGASGLDLVPTNPPSERAMMRRSQEPFHFMK